VVSSGLIPTSMNIGTKIGASTPNLLISPLIAKSPPITTATKATSSTATGRSAATSSAPPA